MPLLLKKLTRPLFQYRLPVSGKVAIGRDKAKNDLLIDEPSVSRIHAELEVSNNNQVTLKDLGSSIGTLVREKKLEKNVIVQVSVGDHLRFGITEFNLVDVPIVICTSGLSGSEKEKVSRLAKQMGIKVRNELDASVTHVIIMPNGWTVTSKLLLGLLAQKEIVTPAWMVAMHEHPLLGIPDCDKYRPGPLSERHLTELGTVISMTQSQAVQGEATAGGVQPDFHIRKDRSELFAEISIFIIPASAEAKVNDEKELLRRGGARKFVLSSDPSWSSLATTVNNDIDHHAVLVCPSSVAMFRQSNPSLAYLPAVDKSHIILSILLGGKLVPFAPEEGAKPPSISNSSSRMSPVVIDRSFRLPPMSSSRGSSNVINSKRDTSPVVAKQPVVTKEGAVDNLTSNKSTNGTSPVAMRKENEEKKMTGARNQQLEDVDFNLGAKPPKMLSTTSKDNSSSNMAAKFSTPQQHSSGAAGGSPLPPLPVGSSVGPSSFTVSSKQSESEGLAAPPSSSSGPRIRMDFDVQALVHERPTTTTTSLNHPPPPKQKVSPVRPLLSEQLQRNGNVKPQAGAAAKSKLPMMSAVKPPPPPQQHQKTKKSTFDLPAEDEVEERVLVVGGYDMASVVGSEKQEYLPPKDLGWLEKPASGGSMTTTTTTSTMPDEAMMEGSGKPQADSQMDGMIGASIVETEDLVVRRQFHEDDDELQQQKSRGKRASNQVVVVDQKKFRKNKIIPSSSSKLTHKEVEVKVEASMAEQVRENNLKNEEKKILQAFGEFFQGDGKKRTIIQPTMKDYSKATTTTTTTTTTRKRGANTNNNKKKTMKGKKKRGYDSESSSSLDISTSESDFDIDDDDEEEEQDEVELLTDDEEDAAPNTTNQKQKKNTHKDDSIEIVDQGEEEELEFIVDAKQPKATSKTTSTSSKGTPTKRARLMVDDKAPIVKAMTSSLVKESQKNKNVKTVESVSTGVSSSSPGVLQSKKKTGHVQTSLNLKARKRT